MAQHIMTRGKGKIVFVFHGVKEIRSSFWVYGGFMPFQKGQVMDAREIGAKTATPNRPNQSVCPACTEFPCKGICLFSLHRASLPAGEPISICQSVDIEPVG
jgi:hypothetical protein